MIIVGKVFLSLPKQFPDNQKDNLLFVKPQLRKKNLKYSSFSFGVQKFLK